MIRIAALNAESSFDEDQSCSHGPGAQRVATKEAQEAEAFQLYSSGLAHQQHGDLREAEEVFHSLLLKPFVKEAVPPEEEGEVGPLQPCLILRYSLHKNLANIASMRGDENEALEQYLQAVSIDSKDVSVWYRMGKLAVKLCQFQLARYSFEQGLLCNPHHTLCLDQVISVLYTLHNYEVCLDYIGRALERDPGDIKALAFLRRILKDHPSLHKDHLQPLSQCDPSIYSTEVDESDMDEYIGEALKWREQKREKCKPAERPLVKLTKAVHLKRWEHLGQSLVALYDYIEKAPPHIRLSCRVDLLSSVEEISEPAPPPVQEVSMDTKEADVTTQPPEGGSEETPVTTPQPPIEDSKPVTTEEEEIVRVSHKRKRSIFDDPSGKRRSARRPSSRSRASESGLPPFLLYAVKSTSAVRSQREKDKIVDYQEVLRELLPEKLSQVAKDEDIEMAQEDPSSVKENEEVKDSEVEETSATENSEENTSNQEKVVDEFMSGCDRNNGLLDVLNRYLLGVIESDGVKWSSSLVSVFHQAYVRFRSHMMYPDYLCKDAPDSRIKAMAELCLFHCELLLDKYTVNKNKEAPKRLSSHTPGKHPEELSSAWFKEDLFYVLGVAGCQEILGQDCYQYGIRAYWLHGRYLVLQGQLDAACEAFQMTLTLLRVPGECEEAKITLAQCAIDNCITADAIKAQLEQVNRCQSFEALQRLSNKGDYEAVVELLTQNFHRARDSNKFADAADNAERQGQLLLLVDSLVELKDYKRGMLWGEMSFDEALQQFQDSTTDGIVDDWQTTMLQLLMSINRCADEPGALLSIPSKAIVRLTSNLLKVIEIATDVPEMTPEMTVNSVLPWILLYKLVAVTESQDGSNLKPQQKSDDEDSEDASDERWLPPSMRLLGIAHDCLGRHSWCVTSDGELLHFIVNEVMRALKKDYDDICFYKDELEQMIEQCFYCMYCYPSKRRPKHLQDHNVPQVSLSWVRCSHLFDYFKPTTSPEFDSIKNSSITQEQESLLQRISTVIPTNDMPILDEDVVRRYIDGATDTPPAISPEFMDKIKEIHVIQEIFYLLADYYFKNKDESKAVKFYRRDLCVMPNRFDSWAGIALAQASQLENKLKPYEFNADRSAEKPVWKQGRATLRCFQRALELDGKSCKLWIEYGSLAYQLHSHASRRIKQPTLHNLTLEETKKMLNFKLEMLRTADVCYRRASETHQEWVDEEEEWLYHYMLGKVAEKLQRPPKDYLEQYKKAALHLHEDSAKYPKKITYVLAPPHLAIEALEVFYRLHVSVFKLLMRQPCDAPYDIILAYLNEAAQGPFSTGVERKSQEVDYASKMLASSAGITKQKPVDHTYFCPQSSEASCSSLEAPALASSPVAITNQRTGVAVVASLSDSVDSTPCSPATQQGNVSQTDGAATQVSSSASGGVIPLRSGGDNEHGSVSSAVNTTDVAEQSLQGDAVEVAVEEAELMETDQVSCADGAKTEGSVSTNMADVKSVVDALLTATEKTLQEGSEDPANVLEPSGALIETDETPLKENTSQEPTDPGIPKLKDNRPLGHDDSQDLGLSQTNNDMGSNCSDSSEKVDSSALPENTVAGQDCVDDPTDDLTDLLDGPDIENALGEVTLEKEAVKVSHKNDDVDEGTPKSGVGEVTHENGVDEVTHNNDVGKVTHKNEVGEGTDNSEVGEATQSQSSLSDIMKELMCMNALASSQESSPVVPLAEYNTLTITKTDPLNDAAIAEGDIKTETVNEAEACTSDLPTPESAFRAPNSARLPLLQRKHSTSSSCSGFEEISLRVDPLPSGVKEEAAVCSSSEDENPAATARNVIAELMQLSEAAASVNTKPEPGLSDLDFGISGSSQDSEPKAEPDSAGQDENPGDISTADLELLTSQLLELNKDSADSSRSEGDQKLWAKDLFAQSDDALPSTSTIADNNTPGTVSSSCGAMENDDILEKQKQEVTSSSEVKPEPMLVSRGPEELPLHATSSCDMEAEAAVQDPMCSGTGGDETVKEEPTCSEIVTSSDPSDLPAQPDPCTQDTSIASTKESGSSCNENQANDVLAGNHSVPVSQEVDTKEVAAADNESSSRKESTASTSNNSEQHAEKQMMDSGAKSKSDTNETTGSKPNASEDDLPKDHHDGGANDLSKHKPEEKSTDASTGNAGQSELRKDGKLSSTETEASREKAGEGAANEDMEEGACASIHESREDASSMRVMENQLVPFGEMAVAEMKPPSEKYEEVLRLCLEAFRLCATRFPQHHKSIYRMACMYYYCKKYKNRSHAQDMLLGNPHWMKRGHMVCPGLFQERKQNNFFQGLWVNPIADIERAGSFASHLERSLRLLLRILYDLEDSKTLHSIHTSLSRTPDLGKKYLSDCNRVEVSRYALKITLDVLRKKLPIIAKMDFEMRSMFILEVHRVWQSCKQAGFGKLAETLLTKTFTLCYKGKLSGSVLDQVNQFVQVQLNPKPHSTAASVMASSPATSSPGRSWCDALSKPLNPLAEATKATAPSQLEPSAVSSPAAMKASVSPGYAAKKLGRPVGSKNLPKPGSGVRGVKRPATEGAIAASKQTKTSSSADQHAASAIAAYQGQVNVVFSHLLSSLSTAKDGATVMYLLNVASSIGLFGSSPQATMAQQQLLAAMMMNPNASSEAVASMAAMMASASSGAAQGKRATSSSGSSSKTSSGSAGNQKADAKVASLLKSAMSTTTKATAGKSSDGRTSLSKPLSSGTHLGKIPPSGQTVGSLKSTVTLSKPSSSGTKPAPHATAAHLSNRPKAKPDLDMVQKWKASIKSSLQKVKLKPTSVNPAISKPHSANPSISKPTTTKLPKAKSTITKPPTAMVSQLPASLTSKPATSVSSSVSLKKPSSHSLAKSHLEHYQRLVTSSKVVGTAQSVPTMKNPPTVQRTVSHISDDVIGLVPDSCLRPDRPSLSQPARGKPAPPKLAVSKPSPAVVDDDSSDCIVISTSDSE